MGAPQAPSLPLGLYQVAEGDKSIDSLEKGMMILTISGEYGGSSVEIGPWRAGWSGLHTNREEGSENREEGSREVHG